MSSAPASALAPVPDGIILTTAPVPETSQAKRETQVQAANDATHALATKCIEIGKRVYKFNQDAAEFERTQFDGKSFKTWFTENVSHIVEFRSKFPPVQRPGTHEKLTLTLPCININDPNGPERTMQTREYSWEEFVNLHMSVTLQYLNRLLEEYAPEVKPPKPPRQTKPQHERKDYKAGFEAARARAKYENADRIDELEGQLAAIEGAIEAGEPSLAVQGPRLIPCTCGTQH